ncbi:hypothetical protein F383_14831 [Gossypium arboreum]|uniref:Uncharacterized protein n=1 Tax=Gossypium arboreum TaxID=29729 RepID=A0A0B0PU18_GOSAR|nr:hypothetical protein F383_14831 [Gossypium arboreum]
MFGTLMFFELNFQCMIIMDYFLRYY